MLSIDGSMGEGGGQILRTSLALSLVTNTPFGLYGIRARRKKPGLRQQHLTCVNAAAKISNARVKGAALHSMELTFEPGEMQPGAYYFSVGTAGSTTLVLQSVLPALLLAKGKTKLRIEGGTHNPMAPPFDFLEKAYLPLLRRMGAEIELRLVCPGFYPAGGGIIEVDVKPADALAPLELLERGKAVGRRATALVSRLPRTIAERELAVVQRMLEWKKKELRVQEIKDSPGPGNALTLELQFENLTEVFVGFGEIHKRAEIVAKEAVRQAKAYLASDVPVGPYLADQLLLPLALAGGGRFLTTPLSTHATTNIEVIQQFVDVHIATCEKEQGVLVEVS